LRMGGEGGFSSFADVEMAMKNYGEKRRWSKKTLGRAVLINQNMNHERRVK